MGRIPLFSFVAAAVLGGVCFGQPTSQTWELRGKDWQPVTPAVGTAATPSDPALDEIAGLIDRNRGKEAFKRAIAWLKINRDSPQRPRALLLASQGLKQSGDGLKAFYYCDELLDLHADSPYYAEALQLQYEIADEYLSGKKRKILGIPIGDMTDEAKEMLFRIQTRAAGSQLAERSIRRTADYDFSKADYDLAGDAYAALLRQYPRTPDAPTVRLQQAFSYQAQFRDERFDATPLLDARAQFSEVMASSPSLAAEKNVGQFVERIDVALARKLLKTGDYYRRTREPRAAAYLYNQVLSQYPNTPEAARAQEAIDRLPQSARDDALAPPPPPAAPTAQAK